jgi:putative membrane protein
LEQPVNPDFDRLIVTGIGFSLLVLAFFGWRFGTVRTVVFIAVAGMFPAIMDFISSFVVSNYEYPDQTRLWVFTYIFFGWMAVCGTCILIAEGMLAGSGEDLLNTPRMRWQVPILAGTIAVLLDLFIDPIAVVAGYWVWIAPANLYFEIPLLNFVGWFVLMFLSPLAWIEISRHSTWNGAKMLLAALLSLPLLCVAAIALSLAFNGMIYMVGLQ